jgi:hypothetical protein
MAVLTERHNPSPRQIKFRDEYRSQIHPSYNGPLHIGVIYVVGLAVVTWCAGRLENASRMACGPGVRPVESVRVVHA